MLPISTLITLATQAAGVIGSFSGSAAAAKASALVQDAAKVYNAVTPLIQQFTAGQEVTEADVRQALAGMDAALAEFDAAIAAAGG